MVAPRRLSYTVSAVLVDLSTSRALSRPSCERSSIALGVLLSVTACDPEVALRGRLTSSNGQPVKVGEIRVECPELCAYAAVQNEGGDFSARKIGPGCPVTCRVRVRSAGHRDFVAPASKYCVEARGPRCSDFEVNVTLEPSK